MSKAVRLKINEYGGMSPQGFHNLLNILRALGATEAQVNQYAEIYFQEVERLGADVFDATTNERLLAWMRETKIC